MKHLDMKAIFYILCVFVVAYGMLYLMWTGANYLFIDGGTTKANTLDVVMIVIVSWYATRDIFFNHYRPNRTKHGRKEIAND